MIFLLVWPAFSADSTSLSFPLNVLDKKGEVYGDLRADDLQIEIGGKPVPIVSVSRDQSARRVVLLLDTGPNSSFLHSLQYGQYVAKLIPSAAHARLVEFGDKLYPVSPGFETADAVRARFANLNSEKRRTKDLMGSLHQAAGLFEKPQFGDAIYIVTSGESPSWAPDSTTEVGLELLRRGIRVFIFHLGCCFFPVNGASPFLHLADITGGYLIEFPDKMSDRDRTVLESQVPQVVKMVEGPYRIEVTVSSAPLKKIGIGIKVKSEAKRNVRELIYPRQFVSGP
jgi:hypothetical protein